MNRYFLKRYARSLLNQAIKKGTVVKKPCEVCGDVKSQGHHDDYNKPLEVKWLCHFHHLARHQVLRGKIGSVIEYKQLEKAKCQLSRLEEKAAQIEKMVEMVLASKTLREIGKEFGITSQAIGMKLKSFGLNNRDLFQRPRNRKTIVCLGCGIAKEVYLSDKRLYCSKTCKSKANKKTPEERRRINAERVKAYLHRKKAEDPVWYKEKIRRANIRMKESGYLKNYYQKNKERLLKKHKEYQWKNIEKFRAYWRKKDQEKREKQKLRGCA